MYVMLTLTSLSLSKVLHAHIRHARTGRALLFWCICGDRVDMRAYSKHQYRRALDMLGDAWVSRD